MNDKIVTFGEIMLRFSRPNRYRLCQGHAYRENYGGSEANVSVSLATLGELGDTVGDIARLVQARFIKPLVVLDAVALKV